MSCLCLKVTLETHTERVTATHPWPGISGILWWDDAAPGSQPQTPKLPVGLASGTPLPCLSLWTNA